jgi:hypothetical protein
MTLESKEPYRIGDTCQTGQEIALILGQSPNAAVFTTADKHLRWEYYDNEGTVPPRLDRTISRFDSLMAEIATTVPRPYKQTAYLRLGKALFALLNSGGSPAFDTAYLPVTSFVRGKARQSARVRYVAWCLLVATAAATGGALTATVSLGHVSEAVQGAVAGVVGAMTSVLFRSRRLHVEPYAGQLYLALQAGARILVGAVFGTFVVIASKANLALGVLASSSSALVVVAFVAGFAERFVPELLRGIEERLTGVKEPDAARASSN